MRGTDHCARCADIVATQHISLVLCVCGEHCFLRPRLERMQPKTDTTACTMFPRKANKSKGPYGQLTLMRFHEEEKLILPMLAAYLLTEGKSIEQPIKAKRPNLELHYDKLFRYTTTTYGTAEDIDEPKSKWSRAWQAFLYIFVSFFD